MNEVMYPLTSTISNSDMSEYAFQMPLQSLAKFPKDTVVDYVRIKDWEVTKTTRKYQVEELSRMVQVAHLLS